MGLRRARQSEIEITLGHFARLRERLAAAEDWLQERLHQLAAGQMPDYDLGAYAQQAGSYEILGQRFVRRMREAGVTLG